MILKNGFIITSIVVIGLIVTGRCTALKREEAIQNAPTAAGVIADKEVRKEIHRGSYTVFKLEGSDTMFTLRVEILRQPVPIVSIGQHVRFTYDPNTHEVFQILPPEKR